MYYYLKSEALVYYARIVCMYVPVHVLVPLQVLLKVP
jgi:hypothetical protein